MAGPGLSGRDAAGCPPARDRQRGWRRPPPAASSALRRARHRPRQRRGCANAGRGGAAPPCPATPRPGSGMPQNWGTGGKALLLSPDHPAPVSPRCPFVVPLTCPPQWHTHVPSATHLPAPGATQLPPLQLTGRLCHHLYHLPPCTIHLLPPGHTPH